MSQTTTFFISSQRLATLSSAAPFDTLEIAFPNPFYHTSFQIWLFLSFEALLRTTCQVIA